MLNNSRLIENNDYKLTNQLLTCTSCNLNQLLIKISDVAKPLSYKTKTTYFFKTKTTFSRPRSLF